MGPRRGTVGGPVEEAPIVLRPGAAMQSGLVD